MTHASHAATTRLTPMFEQYLQLKAQVPDALLFYRMGDFYELFFEDAETAARELQIVLTARNSAADNPIPMCGVPHHSLENYLPQLLERGYRLAICEQVEDPKTAKGLVKREIIRILTPGTTLLDATLSAKQHTYLGALYWDVASSAGGFAWVEHSTGQWTGIYSKKEADLWQWAQKMAPRELLVPDPAPEGTRIPQSLALPDIQPVYVPALAFFDYKKSVQRVFQVQGVADLAALGLAKKPELVRACGALLVYLEQTQRQELAHLSHFIPLDLSRHLIVDEVTERNLELFRRLDGRKGQGTLIYILDATITPMGGRLLEERLRHPWREMQPILETQEAVSWFFEHEHLRSALRESLRNVYDLERLSTRIFLNRAQPRDFVALRQGIAALPKVQASLFLAAKAEQYPTAEESSGKALPPVLHVALRQWDNLEALTALLQAALVDEPPTAITEGGLFKHGYSSELDTLLDLAEHGEQLLADLLAQEQVSTGLSKLKLGYNRVFGHYFEITRAALASAALPEYFIRKQTLAAAERFTTPQLQELEVQLLSATEDRVVLEHQLFMQLRELVAEFRPRVLYMADLLAGLDYWQSLAETAHRWNFCKPVLHEGTDISIKEGRHPVVEQVQGSSSYIPNDIHLDDRRKVLLITGPNMAGKSTILRQVAITSILAQMGSFVPAREAYIGIADRVYSRVGASDNLAQGQSTFMVEMMETARILRQATRRSLVILDEIGRGTSTFDGLALAWAVAEELAQRQGGIRTLFATHYHELTALEGVIAGIHCMNIAIREWNGEIVFLRRLVPGPSDRSYGIEVARLAGVPQSVVSRARYILVELEKTRDTKNSAITASLQTQLLPGLQALTPAPLPASSDSGTVPAVALHPVLTSLQDVDTDNLTPMGALNLLTEWKLLWGNDAT